MLKLAGERRVPPGLTVQEGVRVQGKRDTTHAADVCGNKRLLTTGVFVLFSFG